MKLFAQELHNELNDDLKYLVDDLLAVPLPLNELIRVLRILRRQYDLPVGPHLSHPEDVEDDPVDDLVRGIAADELLEEVLDGDPRLLAQDAEHHLEDGAPDVQELHLGLRVEGAGEDGLIVGEASSEEVFAFAEEVDDATSEEGLA